MTAELQIKQRSLVKFSADPFKVFGFVFICISLLFLVEQTHSLLLQMKAVPEIR